LKPKDKFLDRFWPKSSSTESEKENNKPIQERAIPMEVIDIQKHVQTIYKITGTETSCKQTLTQYTTGNEKWANVHTAEDSRCHGHGMAQPKKDWTTQSAICYK
jgi:hypothetical protein